MTKNLYDYIMYKRYKTYVATSPQNFDINDAVLNLGFNIIGKPLDKKQGANACINMNFDGDQMLKALSMSYYGNQLGVHLSVESIVIHAVDLLFQ